MTLKKDIPSESIQILLEQYERSFKKAYEKNQEDVTREILKSIDKIIHKATLGENNEKIIDLFCNTGPFGPFLQKIQQIISNDSSERNEKYFFSTIVMHLPGQFLFPKKSHLFYLESFVPNCLFDIIKIIIDKEDFISFDALVEQSTLQGFFDEPGKLISEINTDMIYRSFQNEDELRTAYNLSYALRTNALRSYPHLMEFKEKFDEFHNSLLKSPPIMSTNFSNIDDLWKNIETAYVTSRIYESFFWMGSYLIFKGKKYEKFLKLFWNISNPSEGYVSYQNKPPIPTNLMWSLNVLFHHEFDDGMIGPKFTHYQSVMPFFYKFFALLVLDSREGLSLPSKRDLEPFFEKDPENYLARLSGYCSRLQSNAFFDFTKNLFESVNVESILQKPVTQEKLNEKLRSLQDKAKECQEIIIKFSKMEPEKIQKTISDAESRYYSGSRIEKLSAVNLVETNIPETEIFSINYEIPKDAFQENSSVAHVLEIPGLTDSLFHYEENSFYASLKNTNFQTFDTNSTNLMTVIEERFEILNSENLLSDYVLMNPKSHLELLRKHIIQHNKKIEFKTTPINIITLRNVEENEIYLINKSCIETLFQQLNKVRFGITVNQDPNNPKQAIINLQMVCKTKIVDNKGIEKLILI